MFGLIELKDILCFAFKSRNLRELADLTGTQEAINRLASLKQYLQHSPDNIPLLLDAVATAVAAGNLEEAGLFVDEALRYAPASSEAHAHAGYIRMLSKDFNGAIDHYKIVLEAGLAEPVICYNLAFSYYRIGFYDDALSQAQAIEWDGSSTKDLQRQVNLLIARCLYRMERFDEAINELQAKELQAVPESEQNAEVLGLMALLYCDNNQVENALAYSARSLDVEPEGFEALVARATCLVIQKEYDQAYADYERILESHPTVGRAWSGLGQIRFHRFQFNEAAASLRKAVEFMPDHLGTWHLLGWAHMATENYEEARDAFESAYELDRAFAETHGCLASLYAVTGEHKKAERHIKLAQKLDPSSMGYLYAKMVLLQKSGKTKESQRLFDRALNTPNTLFGGPLRQLVEARMRELEEQDKTPRNET